jgi:hypothetical protein
MSQKYNVETLEEDLEDVGKYVVACDNIFVARAA